MNMNIHLWNTVINLLATERIKSLTYSENSRLVLTPVILKTMTHFPWDFFSPLPFSFPQALEQHPPLQPKSK